MFPEWFSEWVIFETDNWHLKPGTPEEYKKEFEEWMKIHDPEETGKCVD